MQRKKVSDSEPKDARLIQSIEIRGQLSHSLKSRLSSDPVEDFQQRQGVDRSHGASAVEGTQGSDHSGLCAVVVQEQQRGGATPMPIPPESSEIPLGA
jgi:hypothetical protein